MYKKKFNMSLFKGKILLMTHKKNKLLNKFLMNSKRKKKRILIYKIPNP